ncbi:hypothetical protein FISHEDRAFT_75112 [Fistulina hepatica ATCC 64428]|uniref:Protein kinase domain-containing protein n=1 Tax=Fistulina hepatica ATCC 64428 TaxID=1128425 RepID=A0A0D7A873_9AGAR|nr:hypothetical protein FISHEDRAFT_75112 [Fistulina hepatica ATCC 64428]
MAFSSVTIRGVIRTADTSLSSTVVKRAVSFPSRRATHRREEPADTSMWPAASLPVTERVLELELGKSLGHGRIGFAYIARVVGTRARPDGELVEPPPGFPTDLCVKFANPLYCRSMAREAWFYEQLPEEKFLQGVVVPRCYGFFTTALSADVAQRVKPWRKIKEWEFDYTVEGCGGVKFYEGDFLPDDGDESMWIISDDARSRDTSMWNLWRPCAEVPLLSVLITERHGTSFPEDVWKNDEKAKEDVKQILMDLALAGVYHSDVKYNNVLKAHLVGTDVSTAECPRHKRVHNWRIIDFDRSMRWAPDVRPDYRAFRKLDRELFLEEAVFWNWIC